MYHGTERWSSRLGILRTKSLHEQLVEACIGVESRTEGAPCQAKSARNTSSEGAPQLSPGRKSWFGKRSSVSPGGTTHGALIFKQSDSSCVQHEKARATN